jgi:hypothetical protein
MKSSRKTPPHPQNTPPNVCQIAGIESKKMRTRVGNENPHILLPLRMNICLPHLLRVANSLHHRPRNQSRKMKVAGVKRASYDSPYLSSRPVTWYNHTIDSGRD